MRPFFMGVLAPRPKDKILTNRIGFTDSRVFSQISALCRHFFYSIGKNSALRALQIMLCLSWVTVLSTKNRRIPGLLMGDELTLREPAH